MKANKLSYAVMGGDLLIRKEVIAFNNFRLYSIMVFLFIFCKFHFRKKEYCFITTGMVFRNQHLMAKSGFLIR